MWLRGKELIKLGDVLTEVLARVVVEEAARVDENVTGWNHHRLAVRPCV